MNALQSRSFVISRFAHYILLQCKETTHVSLLPLCDYDLLERSIVRTDSSIVVRARIKQGKGKVNATSINKLEIS